MCIDNRLRAVASEELDFNAKIPPVVNAFASIADIRVPVVTEAPDTWKATPAARAAEAVTFNITVSSFAAEANSERIPEVDVAPVWSTLKSLPAPVIAVADDVITAPIPDVNPFPFILSKPAAVVAEFAVRVIRLEVVTMTPVETTEIPVPKVFAPRERFIPPPDAVKLAPPDVIATVKPSVNPVPLILSNPVEVVAELAAIESTSPVVTIVPVETSDNR